MNYRASIPAALLALLAAACEDTSDTTDGTTSTGTETDTGTGSTTADNQPPEWVDAPDLPLALGEGQTKEIPAVLKDADDDAITVEVAAPEGIEGSVDLEKGLLFVRAGYGTAGPHEIEVTLSDGEATSTVKVTLEVAPLAWLDQVKWTEPDGPEAREHGALFLVPGAAAGADRFVMFGGSGYSPYGETFADGWAFSIADKKWSALTVSGDVPTPAGARRVAPTPEPGVAYLFGGYAQSGSTNRDLYRVTAGDTDLAFEKLEQTNPPPRRALHAFAQDPTTGKLVIFGGFGSSVLGDTWVGSVDGNVATWEKVTTPTAPSPRYGFFYGFDAARSRLIVWSGAQGTSSINPAADAWALDLAVDPPTWSLLVDANVPGVPPGRRNGSFVFDPSGPRLAVFGGTADAATTELGLWMLDLRPGKERWDLVALADEPAGRSSGFGALDAQGHLWMGFGNTAQAVFRDFSALGYAE